MALIGRSHRTPRIAHTPVKSTPCCSHPGVGDAGGDRPLARHHGHAAVAAHAAWPGLAKRGAYSSEVAAGLGQQAHMLLGAIVEATHSKCSNAAAATAVAAGSTRNPATHQHRP